MTDPSPSAADREQILDLVAAAMEALDAGGEPALAALLAGTGRHRDAVLARLRTLRSIGLMAAPKVDEGVPERLGDFQLLERIGSGGMGVVYRARQLSLQREVALKLIRPDQLYFPGVRERFQREVAIVARLQHEGVVRLYSYGEDQGLPWFAMERVPGVSLADVLTKCAGRSTKDLSGRDLAQLTGADTTEVPAGAWFEGSWHDACLRVIELAAQALAAAHAEGVLHRDLKPSNVMVTPGGRVVLLDFGLAWTHGTDRLTRSGAQLGTVHYMAPEQLAGDAGAVDERTDVYALGVVLRELLTLRPAFTGSSFEVVAQRVQAGLATPFDASSSGGRDTETVCLTAMERDRARRYPGAAAFARDLRHVLEHRPIAAVRPGPGVRFVRWTQRHRTATAVAAMALLGLFATPLLVAWRERSLRVALEASNGQLAATNQQLTEQILRADINLALASSALAQTLTRIHDEHLVQVPDLRPFCEGVLADTDGALTALMRTNPDDPETRLRLAETFARAGRVRWEFADLPRTAALFRRAIELVDGCKLDADRVDDLDLDTRLALVYVERRRGDDADAAYQEIERRAVARGDLTARPAAIRAHAARCYARHGALLMGRKDARGLTLLQSSLQLREDLVGEEPSMQALAGLAEARMGLADWFVAAKDTAAAAPHLDAMLDAARQAAAATARGPEDREAVCRLLDSVQYRLQQRGDHAAAVAIGELAEPHLDWLATHQPSRLANLENWLSNRERGITSLLILGQLDAAARAARAALARIEPFLATTPREAFVWRAALGLQNQLLQCAVAAHDDAGTTAATSALVAVLQRCEAQALPACVLCSRCAESWHQVATHQLRRGDAPTAASSCEHALAAHARAVALSEAAKVRIPADTDIRLTWVETLLRLDRVDAAASELAQLGNRLPADAVAAVPSLARYRDDARFAAVFAQSGRR